MSPERWQQVKELFQLAVEREPNQRAPFLDEACTGDPSLQEQIEVLLASDAQAKSFLERSAFEVASRLPTDEQDGGAAFGFLPSPERDRTRRHGRRLFGHARR